MQQVGTSINTGQTIQSSKVGKTGKLDSNSKTTAEKSTQFAEIFGQLSLSLVPSKVSNVKTEASQTDTPVSSTKKLKTKTEGVGLLVLDVESKSGSSLKLKSGAEGIGTIDQDAASTEVKTKATITSELLAKQVKKLEKADVSKISGEVISEEDNELANCNNQVKLTASLNVSKMPGLEKSEPSNPEGKTPGSAAIASVARENHGELKVADLMLARSNRNADNNGIAAGADKPDQIEIKEAGPIVSKSINQAEGPLESHVSKGLVSKSDIAASPVGSAAVGTDSAVNSKEKTKNGDKEANSEGKTLAIKTDAANNAVAGSDKVAVEFEVAETGQANTEKTTLSKTQADLLVSKMVQQIKVAPSSLEVSLKPEYLGKLNILVQSIEGVISVNVIAQNSEAMNLLNANLQSIRDNLDQQGVKVQQLDVSLANQERQENRSGSNYRGESQPEPRLEEINTSTEYGSFVGTEHRSLRAYELNILA